LALAVARVLPTAAPRKESRHPNMAMHGRERLQQPRSGSGSAPAPSCANATPGSGCSVLHPHGWPCQLVRTLNIFLGRDGGRCLYLLFTDAIVPRDTRKGWMMHRAQASKRRLVATVQNASGFHGFARLDWPWSSCRVQQHVGLHGQKDIPGPVSSCCFAWQLDHQRPSLLSGKIFPLHFANVCI